MRPTYDHTDALRAKIMQHLRVCPNCLGEGELRKPPYGYMKDGKWWSPAYAEATWASSYLVLGPCNPCRQTGYLKVLTKV